MVYVACGLGSLKHWDLHFESQTKFPSVFCCHVQKQTEALRQADRLSKNPGESSSGLTIAETVLSLDRAQS
jgi:hypothetical protein